MFQLLVNIEISFQKNIERLSQHRELSIQLWVITMTNRFSSDSLLSAGTLDSRRYFWTPITNDPFRLLIRVLRSNYIESSFRLYDPREREGDLQKRSRFWELKNSWITLIIRDLVLTRWKKSWHKRGSFKKICPTIFDTKARPRVSFLSVSRLRGPRPNFQNVFESVANLSRCFLSILSTRERRESAIFGRPVIQGAAQKDGYSYDTKWLLYKNK